jgi:hypothetical protein
MNDQTKLELLRMAVELTKIAVENVKADVPALDYPDVSDLLESYTHTVLFMYNGYIPSVLGEK